MLRVEPISVSEGIPFAVVEGDVLSESNGKVARITASGAVTWTTDAHGKWLVTRGSRLAFVVGEKDADDKTPLAVVDLASGKTTSVAKTEWNRGDWYRAGDALIRISSTAAERIEPASGKPRWSVAGTFSEGVVATSASAVWAGCPQGVCGLSADTGAALAPVNAIVWQPTPDGKTFAHVRGALVVAADVPTLAPRWSVGVPSGFTATKLAASDAWLVVLTSRDAEYALTAYKRSTGAVVWQRKSISGAYLEYIAAGDSYVAYFDSADTSVHAVHMPDGVDVVVRHLTPKAVVTTDAHGLAPAVPDASPIVSGDLIIVSEHGVPSAYRIVGS